MKYEAERIQVLNPYWSSYICFCEALEKLKSKKKKTIVRWFNQLVSPGDYAKPEKRQILGFLTGGLEKQE